MFPRVLFACFALSAAMAVLPAAPSAAEEKPYNIKDGKVDQHVYNGWRRFGDSCLRCHGPDAAGSSYAPDLTASLKTMSEDTFRATVMGGRINTSAGQQKVMPPFANVEDVAMYLDDIYAYLKARSDGALDRGRPDRMKD
jgi:mono/diheme cytochrome c family protein